MPISESDLATLFGGTQSTTPTPAPAAVTASPVIPTETPKNDPALPPPEKAKRQRKMKIESVPEEAEVVPSCNACGATLNAANGSKSAATGEWKHIGCKGAIPAQTLEPKFPDAQKTQTLELKPEHQAPSPIKPAPAREQEAMRVVQVVQWELGPKTLEALRQIFAK